MSGSEKKHGGARLGSGRKTKYEKTVVMRVPDKYKEAIKALIAHLDDTAYISKHHADAHASDPVFIRSLRDNAQYITFTTSAITRVCGD